MEDSFRVRVDKAFGSLASSSSSSSSSSASAPPSSPLSSPWCLTDEEIERKEWNRDKDSPEPESEILNNSFPFTKGFLKSNRETPGVGFRWELEKDLEELDEGEDGDDELSRDLSSKSVKPKPDDYNDEEWEIKNSIGRDCTLDYEEEEDEYDKVAVGKEKSDDRVYMRGITDYGIDIDSYNELPNSLKDIPRDPRANLISAKLRLKEDTEAAKQMDSLTFSEHVSPPVIDDSCKPLEDVNLKSILKRRDDESDSKLDSKGKKRVRFDPECKDGLDKESGEALHSEIDTVDESLVYPLPPDYPSGIPDYMRNPSKYTRYTFDSSSDVDEQSNRQAFMDFLKTLKKSNTSESEQYDSSQDLPKSLIFIPKRKSGDTEMITNHSGDDANKESMHRKGFPISITAADIEDSEPSAMVQDEPEAAIDKKISSQKQGRKYRIKNNLEMDDSI